MNELIEKYISHFSKLFEVDCNIFDIRLKSFSDMEKLFCASCPNKCDYINTHLYGCYESVRWDNKYIYYCPMGFIFIAVPILNELDIMDYGIISGPILMGNIEDFDETYNLPNMHTSKVNHLAEIMSAVFAPRLKANNNDFTEGFLNDIYKSLEVTSEDYPIGLEKELQNSIIEHDSKMSRELLNKLLGHIFFHSNSDLNIIKSRTLELIVLLSRSAIEGGANVNQIFALNNNYIKEVEQFQTLENLSVWMASVINRFVSYVFEFNDVKHTDMIYKITAYIKENYMKKISLDDIANHVYLSRSYLSKIFKEEMDISITNYINKIRIDKSKILLLDISLSLVDVANLTGFDDQSYFTKLFRKAVGVSPGKYREKHGKI